MEQQQDFFNEMEDKKLPGMLNVLTILTFIGSGFGLLFSLLTPWLMNFSKKMLDTALEKAATLKPEELQKMEESKKAIELVQSNLTINLTVGVIGCILCIVAAVMMRKRKKDGYFLYVFAELAPVIVGIILMKSYYVKDAMSMAFGAIIPALFIILYTTQRKYLTK